MQITTGGGGINVLNFGVDGYGPGQSFLHYTHFEYTKNLDYVFYVFYKNDLKNIYETNLFQLDNEENLVQNIPNPSSFLIFLISKFHITYMFLDATQRLFPEIHKNFLLLYDNEIKREMKNLHESKYFDNTANAILQNFVKGNLYDNNLQNSIDIFKRLMHTWKQQVEKNKGKFSIIFVPKSIPHNIIPFLENRFTTINLYDCFSKRDTEFQFGFKNCELGTSNCPYHFVNDGHWNEEGNRLAAICLYRFLEQEMDLRTISEDDLQDALGRYYSAFEETGHTNPEQEMIRARYSALSLAREGE